MNIKFKAKGKDLYLNLNYRKFKIKNDKKKIN